MPTDHSKTSPGSNGVGDKNPLVYPGIVKVLLKRFPELTDRVEPDYETFYDLKCESPLAYPVFEGLLQSWVLELLGSGTDDASLERIFSFYEEMALSPDIEVVNLLWISVMEGLLYKKELIAQAWKYMGQKTKELAREIAKSRGWDANLPADGRT
jgi:hypothetical protein